MTITLADCLTNLMLDLYFLAEEVWFALSGVMLLSIFLFRYSASTSAFPLPTS